MLLEIITCVSKRPVSPWCWKAPTPALSKELCWCERWGKNLFPGNWDNSTRARHWAIYIITATLSPLPELHSLSLRDSAENSPLTWQISTSVGIGKSLYIGCVFLFSFSLCFHRSLPYIVPSFLSILKPVTNSMWLSLKSQNKSFLLLSIW